MESTTLTETPAGQSLDTIPYDAPLSFPEPSPAWVRAQTKKGSAGAFLTIPDADLTGKLIVITGSNNGIGREAALQFAAWGADLVLACRQPPPHEQHPSTVVDECLAKANEAGHTISAEWWEIDMASVASVEAFTKRWAKSGKTIDILCNNAGMGSSPGGSTAFLTKDGFEIIHQVNFLSHVLVTLGLLPYIAKAAAPRIVCTTSCFHYPGKFALANTNGALGDAGLDGVQYYQNNKLWYQTWLTELQHRLLRLPAYRHITVNGVHPGYVNSGIWTMSSWWKQWLMQTLAAWLGVTPQQGSLAILHAATSPDCGPDPAVQGVGPPDGRGGARYFNRITEEEPMPHTRDPDCRMRVWRKVNDELKLLDKGLLDIVGLKSVA